LPHVHLRGDRHLGKLELGPAPDAYRVVQLDDPAAARALPPELLVLPAVEDRGQQPDERHARRDQEPEDERAALDAAHDPAGQAKEEQDYYQAHVTTGLA